MIGFYRYGDSVVTAEVLSYSDILKNRGFFKQLPHSLPLFITDFQHQRGVRL